MTMEEILKAYPPNDIKWDRYLYLNKALNFVSEQELKEKGIVLKSNDVIFKYKFY